MPVPAAIKNIATSFAGGVQKAQLYIHTATADKLDTTKVGKTTGEMLGQTVPGVPGNPTPLPPKPGAAKTHCLTVQYNPSTLSIQANAEKIPFTYLQQNIDNGVPNQNLRPPLVVLAVELVFDAMNPSDAFMADKLNLSVGNVVSSVAGAIKTGAKGGYTVQPQTNALLASLLRPNTRTVTFRWADMAFTGQIIEAQAKYTMFSVSGKPVRSTVRINIAQQVESESDGKYWEAALDKVFGADGIGGGKGAGQKLGNLVNLGNF